MPGFSKTSADRLAQVHPSLQQLFNEIVKYQDCTILNGFRTIEEQKENVAKGLSKTMDSKHLVGRAVDAAPYPQNWEDKTNQKFSQWEIDQVYFGGLVVGFALAKGIKIRYGGDWNGDGRQIGSGFRDLDHFEVDE